MEQEPKQAETEPVAAVEEERPAAEPAMAAPVETTRPAEPPLDGSAWPREAPAYPATNDFRRPYPTDRQPEQAETAARPDESRRRETRPAPGPNWMLTVVCWIAAATALFEAHALFAGHALHSYAFSGYLTLGVGIFLFSLEALGSSNHPRRWASWLFAPATVLTVIGVICLVMSQAPGRRI